MLLFGVTDETVGGVGAGVVLGGLATLIGVILTGGRKSSALGFAQWRAYGESMAKKYDEAIASRAVSDGTMHAKLLEQAEEIGRLKAENAMLKEKQK